MSIQAFLRRLLKREPSAQEAREFSDFYTSTYGKRRAKPQDKMRRAHEDK